MNAHPAGLYVGTYTTREGEGIYRVALDRDSGELGRPVVAARTANPSFVLPHPGGRYLYAVNELWEFAGRPGGGVSAFAVQADGTLTLLGAECTHGGDPCHLAFDASGRFLLVSNFAGGSLCVLPLRDDGHVEQASDVVEHTGQGHHPRWQAQPHVSAVAVSPEGLVVAADLGADRLVVYRLDETRGTLERVSETRTAPGAGPRDLVYCAGGGWLFVSNELDSTVATYEWDGAAGTLSPAGTAATAPIRPVENAPGHLGCHPGGRWLFVSNRGHDSITTLAIGPDGTLEAVEDAGTGGAKPGGFAVDPHGEWLVAGNQDSDSLVCFRVDVNTGRLRPWGEPVRVPSPVSVAFAP